jgi:hypothetical protein
MNRENLRRFLFQTWLRRLYLDAIFWLKTEGNKEYDLNRMALYETLTRAMH